MYGNFTQDRFLVLSCKRYYHYSLSDSATPAESEATSTPSQESQASADAAPKKTGLKLSYDEYKNMANLFVIYMRRQEEHAAGWYIWYMFTAKGYRYF